MKMRRSAKAVPRQHRIDPSILNFALSCTLALICLVAGEAFSSFFSYSDGETYSAAYESLASESPRDGYLVFTLSLGAAEPLSFLTFYFFSQVVSLPAANWLLNFALLFTIFRFLRGQSVNILCWAPLVLTNYYILILGFGLIRLKIGLLFLIFSWLMKRQRSRWIWMSIAVLAHAQMMLPLAVSLIHGMWEERRSKYFKYFFLIGALVFLSSFNTTREKFLYYSTEGFGFPFRLVALFIASLFLIDRRRMAYTLFSIFFPSSLLIGDGRLNVVYFMLIIHEYLVHSKRTPRRSALLVMIGLYLSFKGIDFAQSLIGGYNYFDP